MSDDEAGHHIIMPDGNVLQFPAGMSDADMAAAIHANTPGLGTQLSNIGTEVAKGIPGTGGTLGEPINATISTLFGAGPPDKNFQERYGAVLGQRRKESKEFETVHPTESSVLGGVGNVASTLPVAGLGLGAKALGMTGDMLAQPVASSATQAGLSAADAYMKGQDVPSNAVMGGLFGAVIPPIAGIAKRGTTALAERMIPAPEGPLQGLDRKALQWAYAAAKNDGLTEAQIAAKEAELGPKGFLMEYGPNLRGLGGAVASKPGTGKTDIFSALGARAKETPTTIDSALSNTLGPTFNISAYKKFIEDSRAAASDPWYEKFRQMKIHPTPELQNLMPALEVAGAGAEGRHLMAVDQKPWLQNFFVPGQQKAFPTAEAYDYMKRGLDSVIQKHKPWGSDPDPNRVRAYSGLKGKLLDALENHPDPNVGNTYKMARQSYADPSELLDALKEGQNWQSIHKHDLPETLNNYTPLQRRAFMQGVRGDFDDMLNDTARGGSKVQNFLLAPSNEQKLRSVVGDDAKVDQLMTEMRRQKTFGDTQSRTIQGSETEPRRSMGQMLEPDPHATMVAGLRGAYMPHIVPGKFVPFAGMAEKAAAEEQAASFEKSRNTLGSALTKSGPEAASFARALAGYKPPSQVEGPMIGYWTNLLLHGASPQVIDQLKQRGLNPGFPSLTR